jgi:hypothetical protein
MHDQGRRFTMTFGLQTAGSIVPFPGAVFAA